MRYWCCLMLMLVVLTPGCKSKRSVAHTSVTGKVLFQGKPLPGGRVTFVEVNGGFAAAGDIDQDGNYQINSPVGEVKIAVNNTNSR